MMKFCGIHELKNLESLFTRINSGHDTAVSLKMSILINKILGTKLQSIENLFLFPRWRNRIRKRIDNLSILLGNKRKYHFKEKYIKAIEDEFKSSNQNL